MSGAEILAKIEAKEALVGVKEALIGVIGLGYVGLPLCLAFGEAGANVLALDVDPAKIAATNEGRTYLKQYAAERIAARVGGDATR